MRKLRSPLGPAAGLAVALAILVLPVAVWGSDPVWEQLADAPAPLRQEVSYVALGGQLYLAAGNHRDHDRYDPATDKWTPVANLPEGFAEIDHVHGVAVGGKIVYIGGLTKWEQPFPVIGDVAIYDPATNSFTEGAEMPSPRAAGGVAAWRGRVIYAGGLGTEGSVARVDAYDPVADKWTQLKDLPRARDHFQAGVVGDELYAIGGRETDDKGNTDEIAAVDVLDLPAEVSDLPTASWREDVTTPLPTPRGGHGVAVVGTCLYAIGGEGAPGVTGATEVYDTVSENWHALASLNTPRHGIQAAVVGQRIFIAGGGTAEEDFAPTAKHEALDVSDDPPCSTSSEEPPGEEPPGEDPPGGDPPGGNPPGGNPPTDQPSTGSGGGTGVTAPGPATGTAEASDAIVRLAIRPRQMPPRGRARVELVLSRPDRIVLRLQHARRKAWRRTGWRLVRRLPAGRTALPFRPRLEGRPLAPGRYRLVAHAQGSGSLRATFRILG